MRIMTVPLIAIAFGTAAFSQTITLAPAIGPPTSSTLVSGSGFSPNAAVDIYFDATEEALVIAGSSGSFSNIALQAPASALVGTNWVTATQRSNHTAAQSKFIVYTHWSEFRFGVKLQGFNPYENALSPSTVSGVDLRWSFTTGNFEYSSPAVANGVIYFGSEDNNVYALNAGTGAKLWTYTTGSSVYSSPAVANGVVYVGSGDDYVYALNASTGAQLWRYYANDNVYSSPVVANGVVYIASGSVHALNASSGQSLWSYSTG